MCINHTFPVRAVWKTFFAFIIPFFRNTFFNHKIKHRSLCCSFEFHHRSQNRTFWKNVEETEKKRPKVFNFKWICITNSVLKQFWQILIRFGRWLSSSHCSFSIVIRNTKFRWNEKTERKTNKEHYDPLVIYNSSVFFISLV